MLVITGEKDFRIPYTQGLASFTALQRRGIPSKLVVFPDENHWVLKPQEFDPVVWRSVRLAGPVADAGRSTPRWSSARLPAASETDRRVRPDDG